jgi:hypothetical protein
MNAKIFWINLPEKYAILHVWLPDERGSLQQTEVFADITDKNLKEGMAVEFDLAYKNGKYVAENVVKTER